MTEFQLHRHGPRHLLHHKRLFLNDYRLYLKFSLQLQLPQSFRFRPSFPFQLSQCNQQILMLL